MTRKCVHSYPNYFSPSTLIKCGVYLGHQKLTRTPRMMQVISLWYDEDWRCNVKRSAELLDGAEFDRCPISFMCWTVDRESCVVLSRSPLGRGYWTFDTCGTCFRGI